jgi:hypothetical protein
LRVGTLTNDKVYFVLYWARPQDFDRYLPVVNQIISSFKLIGNDQQSNIPPGNTGTSRDSGVGLVVPESHQAKMVRTLSRTSNGIYMIII